MSDPGLKRTIDKILDEAQAAILAKMDETWADADAALNDAIPTLEQEYDRIISDGNKEAEKITSQIIGTADLDARNKQLLLIEEHVDRAFERAVERIRNMQRDQSYSNLVSKLLRESAEVIRTNFTVYANERDHATVQAMMSDYPNSSLSQDNIDCMGGVRLVSSDGFVTLDNTLDARLARMKPLIRKEIAAKFELVN